MTTTNTYVTEGVALRVQGRIWSGHRSEHDYALTGAAPRSLADAKRIAGDFEELTKATLVSVRREVRETVTTKRL